MHVCNRESDHTLVLIDSVHMCERYHTPAPYPADKAHLCVCVRNMMDDCCSGSCVWMIIPTDLLFDKLVMEDMPQDFCCSRDVEREKHRWGMLSRLL